MLLETDVINIVGDKSLDISALIILCITSRYFFIKLKIGEVVKMSYFMKT
jgi:hypothetical protein